jgi:alginate production protein
MTGSYFAVRHGTFSFPLGLSLLFTPLLADARIASETIGGVNKQSITSQTPLLQLNTTLKMEAYSLRNANLRNGEKRENELELEPLARFRVDVAKNRLLYGAIELEFTNKTTRKTGKQEKKKTRLDVTQGYIGVDINAINTDLRIGRWLYRDMREWLFDENMDGLLARWKKGKWQADALGARINYLQRDLLDRTSRSRANKTTLATLLRFKVDKDWQAGGYVVASKNTHDEGFRQLHYGLRSHNEKRKGLRHWVELGMMTGNREGSRRWGRVFDAGATYIFDTPLRPRLTLGYAYASKHYNQTGLQSNEGSFGGKTKFTFYGNTLAPELTNLQILTAAVGMDITPDSDLELVYHHYRQTQMADLKTHDTALKSRYDQRSSRNLGNSIDLIWGVEMSKKLRTELIAGVFLPSKRLRASSSVNASRSSPAYSVGFEVEYKF